MNDPSRRISLNTNLSPKNIIVRDSNSPVKKHHGKYKALNLENKLMNNAK